MLIRTPSGISYSDEYFTAAMFDWLLEFSKQRMSVSQEGELPTQVEQADGDVESAFKRAWEEISTDPDFAKKAMEHGYTFEKGLSNFRTALAEPIPKGIDQRIADALEKEYEVRTEDGAFVHYMDGNQILVIPKSVESADMISDTAAAIVYAVCMAIDAFTIICAAVGIYVFLKIERLQPQLQGIFGGFFARLFSPGAVREMERLLAAGKKAEFVVRLLEWISATTNIFEVGYLIFSGMSVWEILSAATQFVAAVLLLISSGGASLVMKIASLFTALSQLFNHLERFLEALQEPALVASK